MRNRGLTGDRKLSRSTRSSRESLRSLPRGLEVLAEMNQLGICTNAVLARRLGLAPSTAHRILMVLTDMGYLHHDPLGHQFVLAAAVRNLAGSFRDTPFFDDVARPRMRAWTARHRLPLLLMTEDSGELTVRASSHAYWPIDAKRHVVGSTLPAHDSSEGAILEAYGRGTGRTHEPGAADSGHREAARRGEALAFASRIDPEGREVHVSVPVRHGNRLVASLSTRGSLDLMGGPDAVRQWAGELLALAAELAAANPEVP